jgi:hypothetical protein
MCTGFRENSLTCSRRAPRLSAEAAQQLSSHFVALRKQVQQVERELDLRKRLGDTNDGFELTG